MAVFWNRRSFLVACGGAMGARAASRQVVDTHIHLYDPERSGGIPWPPKSDALLYRRVLPGDFKSLVRPLGVTGTVVVEASPRLEDNQWVLDLARDDPFLLGVVGNLQVEGFARNLDRFRQNPLFLGIRLNGGAISRGETDTVFQENLRRLADAGLALDAIGNAGMILPLTRLMDRTPKLRVAIDHMPMEPVGWRAEEGTRTALRELASRPQVYAKVSGVLRRTGTAVATGAAEHKDALDEIWEMFGPNRVMYGSNWPVSDRLAPYATVLKVMQDYTAAGGPERTDQFFRANSKACYRWADRA